MILKDKQSLHIYSCYDRLGEDDGLDYKTSLGELGHRWVQTKYYKDGIVCTVVTVSSNVVDIVNLNFKGKDVYSGLYHVSYVLQGDVSTGSIRKVL